MELEDEAAIRAVELLSGHGAVVTAQLHIPVAVLVHFRSLQVLEDPHVVRAPAAHRQGRAFELRTVKVLKAGYKVYTHFRQNCLRTLTRKTNRQKGVEKEAHKKIVNRRGR